MDFGELLLPKQNHEHGDQPVIIGLQQAFHVREVYGMLVVPASCS